MLKILIVDDHSVVRGGLRQFLADAADCRIVGEAGSGREALALVAAEQWDLLLLDIGLPDLNGIDLLKRIKHEKPGLPVLVFSMYAEDDYAMPALEAGAAGYLPKDAAPAEILEAIRRTGCGGRYLSPQLTEKLLAGATPRGRKELHENLSEREFAVMRLLCRGMALIAIGETLHLSPKTVSTYRTRLLEKLNLRNNAELTRYAIEHKLDQ
ncbi:MAG: DNA-binding response regulator [Rhodocyclales bacterium RIFCSPLOWO2_02_FULL_63_24]|nr:MAG: DNA-binding response regulator [Rhodocyclales bacterium RIFCSPLOWO2_02_FULL_63_24]